MIAATDVSLTARAYDVTVRLTAPDRDLLAAMTDRLPPGWEMTTSARASRTYAVRWTGDESRAATPHLFVNEERVAHEPGFDNLLETLARDARMHIASTAPALIFVHAGVVGWQGRAIVIPGVSWSGKTTLVAALLRAGATYFSDEYAVLDACGRVVPYPQPLAIREPLRRIRVPAADLGAPVGADPLPVGRVLLCSYREGAQWAPTRLSPGRAVLALVPHTVSFRRQPEAALRVLRQVVSDATVLEGVRGDAAELAQQILFDSTRGARTVQGEVPAGGVDGTVRIAT